MAPTLSQWHGWHAGTPGTRSALAQRQVHYGLRPLHSLPHPIPKPYQLLGKQIWESIQPLGVHSVHNSDRKLSPGLLLILPDWPFFRTPCRCHWFGQTSSTSSLTISQRQYIFIFLLPFVISLEGELHKGRVAHSFPHHIPYRLAKDLEQGAHLNTARMKEWRVVFSDSLEVTT